MVLHPSLFQLLFLLFILVFIANASDIKPKFSREECVELAKKVYFKLDTDDQDSIKLSLLFESVESDAKALEQCFFDYKTSHINDNLTKLRKLLYKENSNGLCGHLSFDDAVELKAMLAVSFPEVLKLKDYDLENSEVSRRLFFTKLAMMAYKVRNKNGLTIIELFGSSFNARMLTSYSEEFGCWENGIIRRMVYKKGSNELRKYLSSEEVTEIKLELFKVLPEVAVENYNPKKREASLRPFFLKLATIAYEAKAENRLSMVELFGSSFNAKLLMSYFREFVSCESNRLFYKLLHKENSELCERFSLDDTMEVKATLAVWFPELLKLKDYDPEKREASLRPFFVKLATITYEAKAKNRLTMAELFESSFNARLLMSYFNKTAIWGSNLLRTLLYQKDSNELREYLSSEEVIKLKLLLFKVLPDMVVENYDPEKREASLRPFFVKLATIAYEAKAENRLSMVELFGSSFNAKLLMSYFEEFVSRESKVLCNLLYKEDSSKLYEYLSSNKVIKLKLLLFKVLPDVAIKDYDPKKREASLRPFFVDLVKTCKIDEKQDNLLIKELFGSHLNARLLVQYFKDEAKDNVAYLKIRLLLYGVSDKLLKSLPLDNAIRLKFILSRLFTDNDILDNIGKEKAKRFCAGATGTIYQQIRQAQVDISIDKLFSGSDLNANLMAWCIGKTDKDAEEKARKILYTDEIPRQVRHHLTSSQIYEFSEALLQAFPEMGIKDYDVRGEEAVKPFCVGYAKELYEKNYGNDDVSIYMLFGTDPESGEGNKRKARLLTWCVEKFDSSDIGDKSKKLLYREDKTVYDELLPCDVTELQRYLFQVFPEVETDNAKFKDCPDRKKVFCKELITNAHEKLKRKDSTTTVAVFGSQLKAKLAISCLEMLEDKQPAKDARELLYVEPTNNIYPTLDHKKINALANILGLATPLFTSTYDSMYDVTEGFLKLSLNLNKSDIIKEFLKSSLSYNESIEIAYGTPSRDNDTLKIDK